MKLLMEFSLDKPELSKDYRRIFIHLFKTALTNANGGKYYEDYYAAGKSKDYCWSVYLKNPVYTTKIVKLEDTRGKLYFSTSDKKTGFIFFAALMEQRKKILPIGNENALRILSVKQIAEDRVRSSNVLIKMVSPLCVRSHNRERDYDFYYSIAHEEFEQESRRVLSYQLQNAGFSKELSESVRLIPVHAKKVIVKFYESLIETSIGFFELEGDPAVINYLLQAGLGSRKSAGFGMCFLEAEG